MSERRYRRKVASPKQWQAIIAAKGETGCRVCIPELARLAPVEYHHIVPRSMGGDDVANNVMCLCRPHHEYVTRRLEGTRRRMAEALTDAEYDYVVGKLGEGAMQRLFGV